MLTAKEFPALSFVGLEDYTPYAGGGHGFVTEEGYYAVKVVSVEPEISGKGDKAMFKVATLVLDESAANIPQMSRVIYSGVDRKGKTLARQVADFLVSTGTPVETIRTFATGKQQMPIDAVIAQLVGRTGYVKIEFGVYDGELKSEISSWITADLYNDAKAGKQGGFRGRKASDITPAMLAAMLQSAGKDGATAPAGAFGAGPVGAPGFDLGGNVAGPGGAPGFGAPGGAPGFSPSMGAPNGTGGLQTPPRF